MFRLAWKNLTDEPLRLVISAGGVALSLVLILVMKGVFSGSEEHAVAYMRNQPADLWLLQDGVENVHMATSVLPPATIDKVRAIPGVEQAVGVLYGNVGVNLGDATVFSYVFGVEPEAAFGGPWSIVEGEPPKDDADIVIDRVLAQRHGLGLGDQVEILNRSFRVSGLAQGNYGIATSLVFLTKHGLSEALYIPSGMDSYILVQTTAQADRKAVVRRLDAIGEAHSMTRQTLIESDQVMIRSMGVDVIRAMNSVAYVVGMLVIGLILYTSTLDHKREYGVLRAIGGSLGNLWSVVLLQALVSASLGIFVGIALAYGTAWAISTILPEMLVLVLASDLPSVIGALLMVSVLAALLPAAQIGRLDPLLVFRD
jgi:putative ABC transport system permease protein